MEIEYSSEMWSKALTEEQKKQQELNEDDENEENYCKCCGNYIEPEKIVPEPFTTEEALNLCTEIYKVGIQIKSIQWGTVFTIIEPPYVVLKDQGKWDTIYVKVADAEPRLLWCDAYRYIQDIRI